MQAFDARAIERVFQLVDREVWIVTARDGQRRGGLAATWVAQASIDAESPLVVAGLAPNHYTAELVLASRAFALHLVAPRHIELVWRFAIGSGRDRDKLAGLETIEAVTGSPVLADCLAWLDCRVLTHYDCGDRLFFIAEVVAGNCLGDDDPITQRTLFAMADADRRRALSDDRRMDIETQRPLRDLWRKSLRGA